MTAHIISGVEISRQIREELKQEVDALRQNHNIIPGLATVLVGNDPASRIYVSGKEKTAKELGIYSERYDLPENTEIGTLITLIEN